MAETYSVHYKLDDPEDPPQVFVCDETGSIVMEVFDEPKEIDTGWRCQLAERIVELLNNQMPDTQKAHGR